MRSPPDATMTPLRRRAADLRPIRELCETYARTHGTEVLLWERKESGWESILRGSAGDASDPSTLPLSTFSDPSGTTWGVAVVGSDGQQNPPAAGFLAKVLEQNLAHQTESRKIAHEIIERYEEITLLYTISEILGSVISLSEATATILREVVDTLGVRRAALWLHNEERNVLELVAAVGGQGQAGPIPISDEGSLTASVFRSQRAVIMEPDDEFPREGEHLDHSGRDAFLSVPVSYNPPQGESRTIGVINLIGHAEKGFLAGDQKLINAIASQIGAAVENNRLVAESLRQERLGREMELAHDLQLKLLPSVEQFRDRGEVAARCSPADSVGGDFYHLFRLSGGRLGVMIGDVSSHGFAAALIMALTMSAVAIHASEGDPPSEVLRRLHGALIDELETTEMYLTLFYGVIDPAGQRITYANAGHSHAFRVTGSGEAHRLPATNPPFGIIDLDDYQEESAPWVPGEDILFLFTDGLADSLGLADGEEVLLRTLTAQPQRPLQECLQSFFELQPADEELPADDRTAVLVRV
jgi:phosphoserine phosphatase RsbU/P